MPDFPRSVQSSDQSRQATTGSELQNIFSYVQGLISVQIRRERPGSIPPGSCVSLKRSCVCAIKIASQIMAPQRMGSDESDLNSEPTYFIIASG